MKQATPLALELAARQPAALACHTGGAAAGAPMERLAQRVHDSPRMAAQRKQLQASFGPAPPAAVAQRTVQVDTVDFDPVANQPRHGIIDAVELRAAINAALNAAPFPDGPIRNQRVNVLGAVFANNYADPDIPTLATTLGTAIRAAYTARNVILSGGQIASLGVLVRDALVANIQADPVHPMSPGERNGFEALRVAAGAGTSRAKGVPSTLAVGAVPGAISAAINARVAEIQAERNLWNLAALTPQLLMQGAFISDITTRQRALHYQGNHSNVAGWLPAQPAPVDHVSAAADRIYNASSAKLRGILDGGTPWTVLLNNGQPHARRREFEQRYNAEIAQLTNAQVLDSAMAALCGGVSGYIEFSMAHDISRLIYDPVTGHVFVTAHYKWRQGYNPFFYINGLAV
jgi:hypothetical protein